MVHVICAISYESYGPYHPSHINHTYGKCLSNGPFWYISGLHIIWTFSDSLISEWSFKIVEVAKHKIFHLNWLWISQSSLISLRNYLPLEKSFSRENSHHLPWMLILRWSTPSCFQDFVYFCLCVTLTISSTLQFFTIITLAVFANIYYLSFQGIKLPVWFLFTY